HRKGAAVVGDGEILETRCSRRLDHRFDVILAVSLSTVRVEISPHVLSRDEGRERAAGGRLDLAVSLAQLGADPCKAERLIDPFLRVAGDRVVVLGPEDPVLVELQAPGDCAITEGDIVRLRTGEV